jgi:hypothetical protein
LASGLRVPPPHLDNGLSPDCLVGEAPRFFKFEPTNRERLAETISLGTPLVNIAAQPSYVFGSLRGRSRLSCGIC